MSDAKKLIAAATPTPWIRPWAALTLRGIGDQDVLQQQSNLDLAVYAVNRLPDYEELRDAAELLADATRRYFEGERKAVVNMQPIVERTEAALRRLRGDE